MSYIADGKVGAITAVTTGATGTATWMELIPENIGRLGTLVGIILSLVLIVVHLRKMRMDTQEAKYRNERNRLEIEQMKWKMQQERKLADHKGDSA